MAAQTVDPEDASQKVVVCPFPLYRPGSLLEEQADIGGFEDHIAGCIDVIEALRSGGQLSELERTNALAFSDFTKRRGPINPHIQPGATLYFDDLALSYFQHLKLLPRLAQAGFKAFVSSSEADRADELMDYEEVPAPRRARLSKTFRLLFGMVSQAGKVTLGRLVPSNDDESNDEMHPSRFAIARSWMSTLTLSTINS